MKLTIQTGTGNKILRAKSTPFDCVDKYVKKLAQDMMETMDKAEGLGLAAPQVGINKRLIVVILNYNTDHELVIPLVNPEIVYFSEEKIICEEGCLSIPGVYEPVERSSIIRVKFLDLKGNKQLLELSDINARVIQHEVDHLDGILFVDRLNEA
ncbi:peptide deformylase [bacterium]|nr:peptide deformylase [bacterium]